MFVVGITGGIATGKSSVSKMFAELGCPIIDADIIAREVVEPGTKGWSKIKSTFGSEVFHENGQLNRERLGKIIFANAEKRQMLNKITHPEIYKNMVWKLLQLLLSGHQFAVLELALLFETGKLLPYISYTIVVSCSQDQQLDRLMSRNSITHEEAMQRINAQMSLDEKCRRATFVIDNSGSLEDTRKQVEDIVNKTLRQSRKHWALRGLLMLVLSSGIAAMWWLVFR